MARGAIAKTNVEAKIKDAFGQDFIGIQDKKLYVYADDGGEKVQIAIALTCPKTAIATDSHGDYDFTGAANVESNITLQNSKPAEITEEETKSLQELLEKFNLM